MDDDYELAHNAVPIKLPEQNYHGQQGSIDRDDADLARLGKKPVLKVSADRIASTETQVDRFYSAQIWLHVVTGLQLYNSHHLGGHVDVRIGHSPLLIPS